MRWQLIECSNFPAQTFYPGYPNSAPQDSISEIEIDNEYEWRVCIFTRVLVI